MTTKRSAPLGAAASSTRRAFLKFGALAAAPLAAAAPALASGDDTAERLARLEDMESIRALHATLLRAINAGDPAAVRALFADPSKAAFDDTVRHIGSSPVYGAVGRESSPAQRGRGTTRSVVEGVSRGSRSERNARVSSGERPSGFREGREGSAVLDALHITLAEDRQTATLAAACTVHTETPIDSDCTLVQMARLQGEGFVRATSPRTLEARFVKVDGAWKVESAAFAA